MTRKGSIWRKTNKNLPTYGHTPIGTPKAYIYQLFADTGCHLEDILRAIDDWDRWRERERERERERKS